MFERILALLLLSGPCLTAQDALPLSSLSDDGSLALHTLYTAPRDRTLYALDQGYRLSMRDPSQPLGLHTDSAGSLSFYFKRETLLVGPVGDFARPPRMQENYSDAAFLSYSPLQGIEVEHRLAVFSSTLLIQELTLANRGAEEQEIQVLTLYQRDEPVHKAELKGHDDALFFSHKESWKDWASVRLEAFEEELEDLILLDRKAESWGGYEGGAEEFLAHARAPSLSGLAPKKPRALALAATLTIPAGESSTLRVIRASGLHRGLIWTQANRIIFTFPFEEIFEQSRQRYQPAMEGARRGLTEWQALSLARQMMFPPQGSAAYPFLVDSREPTWAGGHDGQSLFTSLALLALAQVDLQAAQDALRLFMAQQRPDGSFPARAVPYPQEYVGKKAPRGDSVPLFAWLSLQLHRRGAEGGFLQESYLAAVRNAEYLLRCDRDGDGLIEWRQPPEGLPYGLDVRLGAPDPGLNALLVSELESLGHMAAALERPDQARAWHSRARALARRMNERLWDQQDALYRSPPNKDGKSNPLSISSFLPLWAGVPDAAQARRMLDHLSGKGRFRVEAGIALYPRPQGRPQEVNGSCCGPQTVSLPLNYLLWEGMRRYGFVEEADGLGRSLRSAVRRGMLQRGFITDTFSGDGGQASSRPHVLGSLIALMGSSTP
ncbi:MAG TPA: trehalase family glycosidase [Acidobacteriota bacterium]|nr:trehalase family glycosidase [Acidobacteriota bacterium]